LLIQKWILAAPPQAVPSHFPRSAAFNADPFNPAIKDGKRTVGLIPPKSNWALALDTLPSSPSAASASTHTPASSTAPAIHHPAATV
jgi:hypothetical protein